MRRSLGAAFQHAGNNFDALRLLAALLVLFSHSFPLTGGGIDPIRAWTLGHTDGGAAAVAAFFVISGFLVTRSVLRHDADAYVRARLLRILPALAVVVVIQTFVLGPWMTTLPWRDYLGQPGTWAGLRNALVFDLRNTLPGVFEANPFPAVVNGSLWTLPVECGFYLALPLLALLGLLRPGRVVGAAVLGFLALYPVAAWFGLSWAAPGPFLLWAMPLYPSLSCLVFFLMGAVLWVHRDAVPLSGGLAVACLIALFASAGTPCADCVFHLTFPYLVLYAGLARPVSERWMRPVGDLSYGTYLYAFPVQQALIARLGPGLGPVHLAVFAAPVVLLCAALSSRLVERPALRLKLRRRTSLVSQVEVAAWPTP